MKYRQRNRIECSFQQVHKPVADRQPLRQNRRTTIGFVSLASAPFRLAFVHLL
jgi:hypothetical protein